MRSEELQKLCYSAKEWVASPEGQRVIQKSLAKSQAITEKLNEPLDATGRDWQRIPYRKKAIAS